MRRDEALPGLTWFWGPELYRRNRVVFREFILTHFSEFEQGTQNWRRVKWDDQADRLDSWLAEARRNRDTLLVRRLLQWKFAKDTWGIDEEALRRELVEQYKAATSPASQAIVLEEFDTWFQLDETTAVALYSDQSSLLEVPARSPAFEVQLLGKRKTRDLAANDRSRPQGERQRIGASPLSPPS